MSRVSKPAREEIFEKIRSALKRDDKRDPPRVAKEPESNAPEVSRRITDAKQPSREELIKQFELELTRVGGHFYHALSASQACDYVESLASERRARSAVSWDAPVIDEIGLPGRLERAGVQVTSDDRHLTDEEFIGEAIHAGLGITGVDYALADTGTLVLLAGEGRARAASLVAPVHVAILKPQQIIPGLNDLIPLVNEKAAREGRELASAVTFITGPSRTADIELTLVVGVHGPQVLHVILLV
ncbi:MAG TPA: lactate utilization protein [Blastocatellia bacterium]|nr:lactate utilization protein [Blastocatellia bacterium]